MIRALEFGSRRALHVRREIVHVRAPATGESPTVLFASDLHLTSRRHRIAADLVAIARREAPVAVLLGGDLVDARSGVLLLGELVRALAGRAPVLAVPGNHDHGVGVAQVRDAVLDAGGAWLVDAPAVIGSGSGPRLRVDATPNQDASREEVRVLLGHHPEVALRAAEGGYDLVLAGHLHGGQCVLWERRGLLYPGAFLSRWNGLRFELGSTTLVVSRGAADTLPVRFRCPREVLVCTLGDRPREGAAVDGGPAADR